MLTLALTDNRGISLTAHACTRIIWNALEQTAMLQFDSWVSTAAMAEYPTTPANDRFNLHQIVLSGADYTAFTTAIETTGAKAIQAAEAMLAKRGPVTGADWFFAADWTKATVS